MAYFDYALPITLKFEGGYANNKDDSGGETIFGISRNNNPHWQGWQIVDAYKAQKGLAHITADLSAEPGFMAMVKSFYKENYWDVNRLSEIKDQQVAWNVFDFGVNSGTGRAARYLQDVVSVNQDGIIGSKTLAAVNEFDPKVLYRLYSMEREQLYRSIAAKNPSQKQFLKSWLSRLLPYKTM